MKYLTLLLIIPAFLLGKASASPQLGATKPILDCKGQECKVQVLVKEPQFNDAIYYTPDQWNEKSEEDINAEKKARVDNHKAFIEEQSKKETNEVTEN